MISSSRPFISLCMITKNEAAHLRRCLASVSSLVDEMIVVDTGSDDETIAIASSAGARIYHHTWENNFSAARNVGLSKARGEWILVLDADEVLAENSRTHLRNLLEQCPADALRVHIHNYLPADELEKYQELMLTRIFRNQPEYRFTGAVHEQVSPSILRAGGKIIDSNLIINHFGYLQSTAQGGVSRIKRNYDLLREAIRKSPRDAYLYYQLGATLKGMGQFIEARQAFMKALDYNRGELGTALLEKLYARLAQLALALDNTTEALQFARKSLELNPQNLVALYALSLSMLFQYQFEEALQGFRAIRNHPRANLGGEYQLDKVIRFCQDQLSRRA